VIRVGSILRSVRVVALVGGSASVAAVLAQSMPLWLAISNSVVFSLSFLIGLRARAAGAHLRGTQGKEMSWSAALLTSFGAVSILGAATGVAPFPVVYCAVGFETLFGYAIGKATCMAAGCCRAKTSTQGKFGLPVVELTATIVVIGLAAVAAHYSLTGSLAIMIAGHLITRCASRYLRTNQPGSLIAPDLAALAAALVLVAVVQ